MYKPEPPLIARIWNAIAPDASATAAFDAPTLLQQAVDKTGLENTQDQQFLEGMTAFLSSANKSGGFHAFGRFYLKQLVIAMLVHRLKLAELLREHPDIQQQRLPQPLFVIGLPRSGTTLLFNLLAQDPAYRYLYNWEAFIGQVPPRGNYTFHTDPRRRQAVWMLRFQKYLLPGLDALHEFSAGGSEECTPVLMQGFATQALAGGYDVANYSAWLDTADHIPTYRHHKQVLQALQWQYPGEQWLLKSPDHLAAIDAIVSVYPDARFVHIHRDPAQSVASWASLNLLYRSLYYRSIDKNALGQQILDRLSADMRACMAARQRHPEARIIDVSYDALTADPLSVVADVYAQLGQPFSGSNQQHIQRYMAENPGGKHGAHHYLPEDFGLTGEQIHSEFREYISQFLAPRGPAG